MNWNHYQSSWIYKTGWQDGEGVAESLEVVTGRMGGQNQGGGIANDFTSSCGAWLELET